ncbi:MAG: hypothetical protein ABIP54_02940, partial [Candidatus Andersenbacteria bacterium]
MKRLVVDIETAGNDFDVFDEITKKDLLEQVQPLLGTPAYEEELQKKIQELQFSPLMGQVVVIGVYDIEQKTGVVSFQDPKNEIGEVVEGNITYKQRNEKSMLEAFWGGIAQ